MNVDYVNPFLNAAIHVLKTMAQVEAKHGKPFLKKGELAIGDITGIISLMGDNLEGSLSVTFPHACICMIVSSMLGEPVESISMDVVDAVGEITNVIAGNGRGELSEKGISLKAGIPTVVTGYRHSIKHMTSGPVIAVPFTTKAGKFIVEIGLKS